MVKLLVSKKETVEEKEWLHEMDKVDRRTITWNVEKAYRTEQIKHIRRIKRIRRIKQLFRKDVK
ncbi:hypothetical protein AXX17_AT3G29890 [Arabidopsis thaliana]|uniref:Uncharacterized protein n=1 Tax=Arabidopsis thaliana TaxID=3702 RepID=A0A178V717_ARATH|nr:hypothetical protein AXX17_AT3G29890 [Arabidopsis thaliana]